MTDTTDNKHEPQSKFARNNQIVIEYLAEKLWKLKGGDVRFQHASHIERTMYLVAAELTLPMIDEMEARISRYERALEKLSRLGNGDKLGNSDGNVIAQEALKEVENDDSNLRDFEQSKKKP